MGDENGSQPRDASMIQPMIMIRRIKPPTNANSAKPVDSGAFLGFVGAGFSFMEELKPIQEAFKGTVENDGKGGRCRDQSIFSINRSMAARTSRS